MEGSWSVIQVCLTRLIKKGFEHEHEHDYEHDFGSRDDDDEDEDDSAAERRTVNGERPCIPAKDK
jgi:hypothetical protein